MSVEYAGLIIVATVLCAAVSWQHVRWLGRRSIIISVVCAAAIALAFIWIALAFIWNALAFIWNAEVTAAQSALTSIVTAIAGVGVTDIMG